MFPTDNKELIQSLINQPTLKLGDQGTEVVQLQQRLTELGVYRQPADGIFDKLVEKAVKLFQFRVFLPEDGVVNSLTWQALETGLPVNMPVLRLDSQGKPVAIVQEVLGVTGHYSGAIDGNYGTLTEAAVRAFQRSVGLVADGIVGQQTWNALSQIPRAYNPEKS